MQKHTNESQNIQLNKNKKRKSNNITPVEFENIHINDGSLCDLSLLSSNAHITAQDFYDTVESFKYFSHNTKSEQLPNGPSYLVGLAVCKTKDAHPHMHNEGILLRLLLVKFTSGLT